MNKKKPLGHLIPEGTATWKMDYHFVKTSINKSKGSISIFLTGWKINFQNHYNFKQNAIEKYIEKYIL